MRTGNTAAKVRKRDTGEQGNRGEFTAVQASDAQVEVSETAPTEAVELPDNVLKVCHFYGLSKLQATRHGDGTVRIDARGRVITDDFEKTGIDPDVLCQQINRHHPDADAHVEDIGHDLQPWDDVVYNVSVTSESEDAASIDQAISDHPLVDPWDDTAEQGIWEGAKTETAIRQAKIAVDAYAERTRAPRQTAAQARARAAYMIYREAAQAETQEAIDGLRDLGARRGAAYVSFPPDDDIENSALLSGHPVFWDTDGEAMDWSEDPSVQNGDEHAAWMFSDRDEAIVTDLAPNVREDRDLDAMSDRTDHAFTYRCTEKGA